MANTGCDCAAFQPKMATKMLECKQRSIFLLLRILLFLFGFFRCCEGATLPDQYFAREPQDQTAVIHTRVTFPCRVINKSGVLQWTRDDFGLGTHRNLSGFERYSMVGSDEEGDYSLEIAHITLDDDAKYQCQVSTGPRGQPGIRSRFATLTVLVPAEPPRIIQGTFMSTTEDREIELECISVGGKPAAEITWIDGKGAVINKGHTSTIEPLPDGKRFTTRSVLKMTPKREHHNHTYTCDALNRADSARKIAKLTLEVKYAPKVTVKILSGAGKGGRIPEGSTVHIGCEADANPSDVTYRWFLNEEPVVGDYTTEMIIFNVSRKYHDSIVKCEVHNIVGKSEESETLDVSYSPMFRSRPQPLEADFGTTVGLSCDVDGNPPPDITWFHEEQDRLSVVGSTPNLTVLADASTAGRYICKAIVVGYPEVEAEASIYLRGPPRVVSHRTQFGIEGDNVRVECIANSVPRPDHVAWTFNNREINAVSDPDYSILEEPTPNGVKSTLIIRESQTNQFGLYNCSVTNEYGADMVEILLTPQRTFPLVFILTGVCAGIILIATFAMLLVLCQRKRRSKEANAVVGKKPDVMSDHLSNAVNPEHHPYKESDRSSNISDLKLELRQVDNQCDLDYSCTGSEAVLHSSSLHIPSNYGLGLPVAVPLNNDLNNSLLMQYRRYSNDYTDPAFAMAHFKDGHNNNGYVPYVDYNRDYNPPSLKMDVGLSTRTQLPSLHSSTQLSNQLNQLSSQLSNLNSAGSSANGSLTRSIDTTSTAQYNSGTSQNNSLQRTLGSMKTIGKTDSGGNLNSMGLPSIGIGSTNLDGATLNHHSALYATQVNSIKPSNTLQGPNGIDVRYAATYGNPYLRTGILANRSGGNPYGPPPPPPYHSVRKSLIGTPILATVTTLSPSTVPTPQTSLYVSTTTAVSTTVTTSPSGSAQPQVARAVPLIGAAHSPTSQYILPPANQGLLQKGQLTRKGNGAQQSLATHV